MVEVLSDAGTIWQREMLRFARKKARIVMSLLTPIIWMGLFAFAMERAAFNLDIGGRDYVSWTTPGIVAMGMLFTSIFSGMSIIFDRQFGLLKEILVAPVRRSAFVMGKGLGGMTTAMVQGVALLAIAALVFGVRFSSEYGLGVGFLFALVVMALIGLSIVNLGVAIAARLESHEVFMLVSNFLVMPMFFLSGALYPTTTLPTPFVVAIRLNPLYYGVDALRYSILGAEAAELPLWVDVGALLVFTIATTWLAAGLFKRA
jgi:ABC-2 type transport system permease protein